MQNLPWCVCVSGGGGWAQRLASFLPSVKLGARGEKVLIWGLNAPVCCRIFQCLLLGVIFKCLITSGHIQYQVQSQNHTGQMLNVGPFPPSDLTQRLTLSGSLKRPLMQVVFYLGLTWNTFALLSNLSPSFLVLAPNLLRGTWHWDHLFPL